MSSRPRRKIRIGFICGKEDGDLVLAPGIPKEYWCWSTLSEKYEKLDPPIKLKDMVHTDIAIWWYVHEHYSSSIIADLIHGPTDVSAQRLGSNDINLLMGWDAVSAHLEEMADESEFPTGHAQEKSKLLDSSRVWPPSNLQELCNNKSNYLRLAQENGIPIAPTVVYDIERGTIGDSSNSAATIDAANIIKQPPQKK